MAGKSETLGNPRNDIAPAQAKWAYPEHDGKYPVGKGPGIVHVKRPDGTIKTVSVRHPDFRLPQDRDVHGVFESDVVLLVDGVREPELKKPIITNRGIGTEAELNIIHPNGDSFDLYPNGQPVDGGAEYHPFELLRNTYEVSGPLKFDVRSAHAGLAQVVAYRSGHLNSYGGLVDPASGQMNTIPSEKDVTPSKYVQTIVEHIGPNILNFTGLGIHEHYDVHFQHLGVMGYARLLAPYLNLGLHAMPFTHGQINPRLGEIFDNEDLKKKDGKSLSSTRYVTRSLASPDGGVGRRVFHLDADSLHSDADMQVRLGVINKPDRVWGPHADLRARMDAPGTKSDHPGRIEFCFKDTAGLRFETLAAYGELSAAIVDRLEEVAAGGEEAIHNMHKKYPRLFGRSYDTDRLSKELERTHRNSISVAYDGQEAMVENGLGVAVSVIEQFKEVVEFAQDKDGHPLSKPTMRTLLSSLKSISSVEYDMKDHLDRKRLPSFIGYLATGSGTASMWMGERAKLAMNEHGMSEIEALKDGAIDRANSFQRYLGSIAQKQSVKTKGRLAHAG